MNNNRSTFVTVVAWVFIVLSGYAAVMTLLQNVMVHLVFTQQSLPPANRDMPAAAAFMFNNVRLIAGAFFLICVVMLVTSIGLLKRKNWARRIFILFLSLGIVWCLGGIPLQIVMMSSMPEMSRAQGFEQFQTMQTVMQWAMAIIGIGTAVLFGWIITRLMSESTKWEFVN